MCLILEKILNRYWSVYNFIDFKVSVLAVLFCLKTETYSLKLSVFDLKPSTFFLFQQILQLGFKNLFLFIKDFIENFSCCHGIHDDTS
jgi:hypothetical protein